MENVRLIVLPAVQPSIFRGIIKTRNWACQETLIADFASLIRGNPVAAETGLITRLGEVEIKSRMTVNDAAQTLGLIKWQENGRIYGAYFCIEDAVPLPSSIIDLSSAVQFSSK